MRYHTSLQHTTLPIILVVALITSTFAPLQRKTVNATGPNDIRYVYDELGQLAGAIDLNGLTAQYRYDAVGNILSVSTYSSTQTSLIEFTPNSGASGSTVTLFGTGFSTTANQNTVTFNGVAATAISATETSITVIVPAGASAGAIGVTTPAGSAFSPDVFSIIAVATSPTIAGFSPKVGAVGATVTISGSNFNTDTFFNNVSLGGMRVLPTSVTGSFINVTVPRGTSTGRVRVWTPAGAAQSPELFFVPPASYLPGDVVFTGELMPGGGTMNVSIPTVARIGLIAFDGAIGNGVALGLSGSTLGLTRVSIYSPSGQRIATQSVYGTDDIVTGLPPFW